MEHRIQGVGQDRGDPRAVLGDGCVTDTQPGHIGDGVVRPVGSTPISMPQSRGRRALLRRLLDRPPSWGESVQRPPTVHPVERYDIAVIGLGGIGSATAWFAARPGSPWSASSDSISAVITTVPRTITAGSSATAITPLTTSN